MSEVVATVLVQVVAQYVDEETGRDRVHITRWMLPPDQLDWATGLAWDAFGKPHLSVTLDPSAMDVLSNAYDEAGNGIDEVAL